MTVFDTADPTCGEYCTQLAAGDPALGFRHKLVLTGENRYPNWTVRCDRSERVLVRVAPFDVPGHSPLPDAGFAVSVMGADDVQMVRTFNGPVRRAHADMLFNMVVDNLSRRDLAPLGFVNG